MTQKNNPLMFVDEYEKLQLHVRRVLPSPLRIHDVSARIIEDPILSALVLELNAYVWSKHDPVTITWPATWWEHAKQRMNERLHTNFTVRTTSRTVYQVTMYPDLTHRSPMPTMKMARRQYD